MNNPCCKRGAWTITSRPAQMMRGRLVAFPDSTLTKVGTYCAEHVDSEVDRLRAKDRREAHNGEELHIFAVTMKEVAR